MRRVLFDAYWLEKGPPSGRNVLTSYIAAWAEAFPLDQITLAVPHRDRGRIASRSDIHESWTLLPVRGRPHGLSVLLGLRSRGHDVVISQNFAPLRGLVMKVVFVHDVIYVRHPEWFSLKERLYLWTSLHSLRRANLVLTSSESEANQIRTVLKSAKNPPVVAVGLGLSESFRVATPERPHELKNDEFLLTVGRLNVRKNVALCAQSLLNRGVISPACPLVVVGAVDGVPDDFSIVADAVADGAVVFLGHVTDSELKWLYQRTRLFVFPSLDEGFGLPILEAQHSGAPLAVSAIPPFRELAPGAEFFDPTDEEDIAMGVSRALLLRPVRPREHGRIWNSVVRTSSHAIEGLR